MNDPISIEVLGFRDSPCGPFPCSEDRSCGLDICYPSGKFCDACNALQALVTQEFGTKVTVKVTYLDDGIPTYVRRIIEKHHPALPIILINGKVAPIGRISLDRIRKEIDNILKC